MADTRELEVINDHWRPLGHTIYREWLHYVISGIPGIKFKSASDANTHLKARYGAELDRQKQHTGEVE